MEKRHDNLDIVLVSALFLLSFLAGFRLSETSHKKELLIEQKELRGNFYGFKEEVREIIREYTEKWEMKIQDKRYGENFPLVGDKPQNKSR